MRRDLIDTTDKIVSIAQVCEGILNNVNGIQVGMEGKHTPAGPLLRA